MFKLLGNALKVSPVLLGLSLLVASGAYAAQATATQSTSEQTKTAATTPDIATVSNESPVESSTSVSQAVPSGASTPLNLAANTLPEPSQTPVEQLSVSQPTGSEISPIANPADTTLAQSTPATGVATPSSTSEVLEQINQYSNEGVNSSQGQVTNVSQLSDVSPGDWAYEALRSLVERYGCIAGYPDGTFRGNRATTRYEFAAGLNACLQQVERLIAASVEGFVTREDLETLQRLVQEFEVELATLGTRVDDLEGRVAFLEDHQFSTTTKLNAEVVFLLSDAFGDQVAVPSGFAPSTDDLDVNTTFADRVRLNFDTSFTGRDRLRTRLQARNIQPLTERTGTVMTEFYTQGGDNDVILDELSYRGTLTDAFTFWLGTTGLDLDDVALAVIGTPSAPSDFGSLQPIYKLASGAGAGLTFGGDGPFRIDAAYIANEAADPSEGSGLFAGSYAALGQITFQATDFLQISGTYVHGYDVSPGGGDGSRYANAPFGGNPFSTNADGDPNVFDPDLPDFLSSRTSVNAYQIAANFQLGAINIGGWVGYSNAIDELNRGAGRADVWNYAATLAFNDFGGEGNQLGFIFGMPPRNRTNNLTGRRDLDTSYHIEAYYRYQLNDNVAIIPGAFVLLNPEHNDANEDIYVGTLQTVFTF